MLADFWTTVNEIARYLGLASMGLVCLAATAAMVARLSPARGRRRRLRGHDSRYGVSIDGDGAVRVDFDPAGVSLATAFDEAILVAGWGRPTSETLEEGRTLSA